MCKSPNFRIIWALFGRYLGIILEDFEWDFAWDFAEVCAGILRKYSK